MPAPLKILAVDDHPVVLVGLRLLFGDHPRFRICAEAATADQARAFAEAWAPDVVVTDLVMGGRDGLFLIEDLATICPASAIIVYSSHDDDVQTTLALRAGAHAFVPKTESLESVEGAIEAVLEGRPIPRSRATRHALRAPPAIRLEAYDLSPREQQVLDMMGRGLDLRAMARSLALSVKTVGTYRDRLKIKLGVDGVRDLERLAHRRTGGPNAWP